MEIGFSGVSVAMVELVVSVTTGFSGSVSMETGFSGVSVAMVELVFSVTGFLVSGSFEIVEFFVSFTVTAFSVAVTFLVFFGFSVTFVSVSSLAVVASVEFLAFAVVVASSAFLLLVVVVFPVVVVVFLVAFTFLVVVVVLGVVAFVVVVVVDFSTAGSATLPLVASRHSPQYCHLSSPSTSHQLYSHTLTPTLHFSRLFLHLVFVLL